MYNKQDEDRLVFMNELFIRFDLTQVVLVFPSMGGLYGMGVMLHCCDGTLKTNVIGFVPVAPSIGEKHVDKDHLSKVTVPVLSVYGEKDEGAKKKNKMLKHVKTYQELEIPGGSHPAYLDNPQMWNSALLVFIQSLTTSTD